MSLEIHKKIAARKLFARAAIFFARGLFFYIPFAIFSSLLKKLPQQYLPHSLAHY